METSKTCQRNEQIEEEERQRERIREGERQ
jgi:hypothetical protein